MVMHLACVMMKMSMPEALAASTINAAYALNRSQTHGSLEIGKQGDLVIINAPRLAHTHTVAGDLQGQMLDSYVHKLGVANYK